MLPWRRNVVTLESHVLDTKGYRRLILLALAALAAYVVAASISPIDAGASSGDKQEKRYIVVFERAVERPGAVARNQGDQRGFRVEFLYSAAIKGYAARLTAGDVVALEANPNVAYIEEDHPVEPFAQEIPTGVKRIYAPGHQKLDIDGQDDVRVNVDVAIIDSGINFNHEDLNVHARENPAAGYAWVSCLGGTCTTGGSEDGYGHGTHVAGIVGAIDNDKGVVGVAPGARLWSSRVFNDSGGGGSTAVITAAVNWVYEHADEIEVANMSLGCECESQAMKEAIAKAVGKGVVFVVAAGNANRNANAYIPAKYDDAIAVSSVTDYDGLPGGLSVQECELNLNRGADDVLTPFSNWGSVVDAAAPGACIRSTYKGGGYATMSGTSMASPHVAGVAAFLASESQPNSKADVESIRGAILGAGSLNWIDDSNDGMHEPLVDLRGPTLEAVTLPATSIRAHSAKLKGVVNPGGTAATYQFQYGTDSSYGQVFPASPATAGSGTTDLDVERTLGVQPNTTYYYRLAVTTAAGTVYGQQRSFTTSAWSREATPFPTGEEGNSGHLFGVSCSSPTDCMAVGVKTLGTNRVPFAERWDGSQWSIVGSVPVPSGTTGGSELLEVACASSSACMAVGTFVTGSGHQPLTQRWNGTAWSVVPVATPADAAGAVTLNDVSCVSASSCVAVGEYVSEMTTLFGFPAPARSKTLVEVWNGTSWTIQESPNPTDPKFNRLEAVSCASGSACLAVGTSLKDYGQKPTVLAARLDAGKWSTVSAPTPSGANEIKMTGLSCTSANACMASGNTDSAKGSLQNWPAGFAMSWDGAELKLTTSGLAEPFDAVSCSSGNRCYAGGDAFGRRWDGSQWSAADFAIRPGATQVTLADISCIDDDRCVAVGHEYGPRNELGFRPLVERLPFAGSLQSTPDLPTKAEDELKQVSCPATETCLAIGRDNAANVAFVEHWNGSEWKIVANVAGVNMASISCSSATFCMVVDDTYEQPRTWTLSYSSFSGWSISLRSVPTPAGSTQVKLQDVSCTAGNVCTAVGHYYAPGFRPLALRWNGEAWSIQTTPFPSGEEGNSAHLFGVSCSSATNCMAVGVKTLGITRVPFAERWNGTQWSIVAPVPVPSGTTGESELRDVACGSSSACVAVGGYYASSGYQPMTQRWNGTAWSVVSIATPADAQGTVKLHGVSCVAAASCVAVGHYVSQTKQEWGVTVPAEEKTLVQTWDGEDWALQPSPNPSNRKFSALTGVSCSSVAACTAVGNSRPDSSPEGRATLGMRFE